MSTPPERRDRRKSDGRDKRILILGSGFGGVYTLTRLVRLLKSGEQLKPTIISDENFFLFTPLLHEAATGRIETRHIACPIRGLPSSDRFNFVQATVERIDLPKSRVLTTAGPFDYDYLVLALGSSTDMSGLHSRQSNTFTLKTLHDSRLIRNHVIKAFEKAAVEPDGERRRQWLTFVVSGGGGTGVQLVTDLRDFIFGHLVKYYKPIDPAEIRVMMIEAESKSIWELRGKFGAYVTNHIRKAGIDLRLESRVTHVWEDRIEINGSEVVPTMTLVWVSGVVANPRIAELDTETDSIGRVLVNDDLELPDFPGVYAVGDCAHFKDPSSGKPIPPRAHIAVRQAKVAADNVFADVRGKPRKRYHYTDNAEMMSLGGSRAIARIYKLRLYGLPARLLWLLGYSSLVPGRQNRIKVIMDWVLSGIFGRDATLVDQNKR